MAPNPPALDFILGAMGKEICRIPAGVTAAELRKAGLYDLAGRLDGSHHPGPFKPDGPAPQTSADGERRRIIDMLAREARELEAPPNSVIRTACARTLRKLMVRITP